jgi:AbrB family looped-hinge helix DNA binding protein
MIETAKVSTKGQVVIPEKFRKKLKITPGSTIVMQERNNSLIITTEKEFEKHVSAEDDVWQQVALHGIPEAWDEDDHDWEQYL